MEKLSERTSKRMNGVCSVSGREYIQLWIHIKHNVGTRPVILTYHAIVICFCFSWLISNSGSILKNSFTSVNLHNCHMRLIAHIKCLVNIFVSLDFTGLVIFFFPRFHVLIVLLFIKAFNPHWCAVFSGPDVFPSMLLDWSCSFV